MSSICGIWQRDGKPLAADEIGRMVGVLSHWQPDSTAAWVDGPVGLGHLALWSTPEAVHERCPFHEPESGVVVTADARLDNRDELIRLLGARDVAGPVIGDVELISRAYLKWGLDCPARLIGDFAFAIWDWRAGRLFCARDPMGVRPFFYYLDERRFLFGSEIKAIFADATVPREWNLLQFAIPLAGLPTFDDQTHFKAIRSLEPASSLCVDATGSRVWKYWRLEMEREIHFARDRDYVDAFEEILQRAVDARLRTTGRVGCMLSGGLDATTCLALAMKGGKVAPEQLSAFSWALKEDDDWWVPDERPFIEAFLREHPLEHAYISADASRWFEQPPEMCRHRDGPEWRVDHCQMVPTFAEARRRGVRVLLNGTGGDETASYAAPDYVLSRVLAGDASALRAEVNARARAGQGSRVGIVGKLLRPLLSPARLRTPFNYQWTYRRRCERVADLTQLGIPLRKDLAEAVGLFRYVTEVSRPRIQGAWRNPLRADQIYGLTQTHVLSDQLAAWDYSASYGIECRCPYLDRRVIEYAVAMPPRQHYFAGVGRRLLRRVAVRRVPPPIADRLGKSPTMPDLQRGIARTDKEMQGHIAAWREDPRVTAIIDVERLAADLRLVVENTHARSSAWAPVLPFCRGAFLAGYLTGTSFPALETET